MFLALGRVIAFLNSSRTRTYASADHHICSAQPPWLSLLASSNSGIPEFRLDFFRRHRCGCARWSGSASVPSEQQSTAERTPKPCRRRGETRPEALRSQASVTRPSRPQWMHCRCHCGSAAERTQPPLPPAPSLPGPRTPCERRRWGPELCQCSVSVSLPCVVRQQLQASTHTCASGSFEVRFHVARCGRALDPTRRKVRQAPTTPGGSPWGERRNE